MKRNNNYVFVITGIVVIGSMLFTILSQKQQDKLDVYDESDIISTEIITTEDISVDTFVYENSEYGFKLNIPSEWNRVMQDGFETYIHSPSASSIQIQILPYDPLINTVCMEEISTDLVQNGYTFVDFKKISSSSYEVLYQCQQQSLYDYVEEVFWNRDCIVKLVCIFNDSNYEKVFPYYSDVINSFEWTKENPIPEDYCLYYNSVADFEFAVPNGWSVGYTDTSLAAMSPDSTAQMTVTANNNSATLENLSAMDMTNMLASGKNNFMLKEFNTSKTKAVAKATYNNGTPTTMRIFMYSNGLYMYTIIFEYYTGSIEESIIDTCDNLFKEYLTQKIIEESELTENIATGTDAAGDSTDETEPVSE